MNRLAVLLAVLTISAAAVAAGRDLDKATLAARDSGPGTRAATLTEVDFRRADLRRASFRSACLWEVDFRGAFYDRFTRWPAGFDPRKRGATLED